MGVLRPELVMRSIIPVVMAGVLGNFPRFPSASSAQSDEAVGSGYGPPGQHRAAALICVPCASLGY
jgi:hypothetical protein